MIKLVYCFKKKPGMTQKAFAEYWEKVHSPIAANIPGLRKLVHSVTVHSKEDIVEPDFDGMAELWFDDWHALVKARQSAEWKASSEDETHFIDHTKVAYFVTVERTVLDD